MNPSAALPSGGQFEFVFADPDGVADLAVVEGLVHDRVAQADACLFSYDVSANRLSLRADDGGAGPSGVLGSAGSVANSQCTIDSSSSSSRALGNSLVLKLRIDFAADFAVGRAVWGNARDAAGGQSGWTPLGTLQGLAPGTAQPSVGEVVVTGERAEQTDVTLTYRAPGGGSVQRGEIIVDEIGDRAKGCALRFDLSTSSLVLLSDDGARPLPAVYPTLPARPGQGYQENTRCGLDGVQSSWAGNQEFLTLTASLRFKAGFEGPKLVYTSFETAGGGAAPLQPAGFVSIGGFGSLETRFDPPDGSIGVATNRVLLVEFREPIAQDSVTDSSARLTANGEMAAEHEVRVSRDGRFVSWRALEALAPQTRHEITLEGLRYASGAAVPATRAVFETGAGPNGGSGFIRVTSFGGPPIPVNGQIAFLASADFDPTSIHAAVVARYSVESHFGTLTPVTGEWSLSPDRTRASFSPAADFEPGGQYEIEMGAARTIEGHGISVSRRTFRAGFAVDSTAPSVVFTSPADAVVGTLLGAPITIEFSEEIDFSTITEETFLVFAGGRRVEGEYSISEDWKQVQWRGTSAQAPNTFYSYRIAGVTDRAGNRVQVPSVGGFTTDAVPSFDRLEPVWIWPVPGSVDVPLDQVVRFEFTYAIEPFEIEEEIPSRLFRPHLDESGRVLSLIPIRPLTPNTAYSFNVSNVVSENGQTVRLGTGFTTGTRSSDNEPPVLVSSSPPNGLNGIPLEPSISLRFNETITKAVARLETAGGAPVDATVQKASPSTPPLEFRLQPAEPLAPSTEYVLHFDRVEDNAGNAAAGSIRFTTVAGGSDTTRPEVRSITPANGATGLDPLTTAVIVFSEPVDPNSVWDPVQAQHQGRPTNVAVLSGPVDAGLYHPIEMSWNETYTRLALTPTEPYLAGRTYTVRINSFQDLAGNFALAGFAESSFQVAGTVDTERPRLISSSPSSPFEGRSGVIRLEFSEPLDPLTVTETTATLYRDGLRQGGNWTHSLDARVWTRTFSTEQTTVYGLWLGEEVKDLSGNPLVAVRQDIEVLAPPEEFTFNVRASRPENEERIEPGRTPLSAIFSRPADPATVEGSVFVTVNGSLVSGATRLANRNRTLEFVPDNPFPPGAIVRFYLIGIRADLGSYLNGSPNTPFEALYRVNPTGQPMIQAWSPTGSQAPLNAPMQVRFSHPMDPATITPANVALQIFDEETQTFEETLPASLSLSDEGRLLTLSPEGGPPANSRLILRFGSTVTDISGQRLAQQTVLFRYGSEVDDRPPEVKRMSPPAGATVPANVVLRLELDETVNPLSVDNSTVKLIGPDGEQELCEFQIQDPGTVIITPRRFLNPGDHVLSVAGVTDAAGQPAAASLSFRAAGEIDIENPRTATPFTNASAAPLNAKIILDLAEPVQPDWINPVRSVRDFPGMVELTPSGRRLIFTPRQNWPPDASAEVAFIVLDYAGNAAEVTARPRFSTTFDLEPPQLIGTTPTHGATNVPINPTIAFQFDELVTSAAAGDAALSLLLDGQPISKIVEWVDGTITLKPIAPLKPGATYTVRAAGIEDIAGNAASSPLEFSFATASAVLDFVRSRVQFNVPIEAFDVPRDIVLRAQFGEPVDRTQVLRTVVMEPETAFDLRFNDTASELVVTPRELLEPNIRYVLRLQEVWDLAGNPLENGFLAFTTTSGLAADIDPPGYLWVSPAAGATNAPDGRPIAVVFDEAIDDLTLSASNFTVAGPAGDYELSIARAAGWPTRPEATVVFVRALRNPSRWDPGVHTLRVQGIADLSGNVAPPLEWTFSVAVSDGFGPRTLVTSVTPPDGAGSVSVDSTIRLVFSPLLDPLSVDPGDIRLTDPDSREVEFRTDFAVSGASTIATLTPSNGLFPNTQYTVLVQQASISGYYLARDSSPGGFTSAFTTGDGPPPASPRVVSVSPADGSGAVPPTTDIVLVFDQTMDRSTIEDGIAVVSSGERLGFSLAFDPSGRTFALRVPRMQPGKKISVLVSGAATGLSGAQAEEFVSSFTVSSGAAGPEILASRPTGIVPGHVPITLFFDTPLDPATVNQGILVTEDRVLLNGSVHLEGENRIAIFTPDRSFVPGSQVSVLVTESLANADHRFRDDTDQRGFLVEPGESFSSELAVAEVTPFPNATIPLNPIFRIRFTEEVLRSSLTPTTLTLRAPDFSAVEGTSTLDPSGFVLSFRPSAPLMAGLQYRLELRSTLRSVNGYPLRDNRDRSYLTSAEQDTAPPQAISLLPEDGSSGRPRNTSLRVVLSEPVRFPSPGDSAGIRVTSENQTISVSNMMTDAGRTLLITPHQLFEPGTVYTLSLTGLEDWAGNTMPLRQAAFTAGSTVDFVAPQVLRLQPSGPDIPTNAWASAVFDEPVDVTPASDLVSVQTIGQGDSRRVPGRVVVSADASTLYYQPDAALDPNASYAVFLARTARDLAGNTSNLPTAGRDFTTGPGPDSMAPAVVASSPPDGSSGAPRNALPSLVMNMPIRWPRLESGDIELIVNGSSVPFELTLLLGDRGIQLGPESPFAAGDIVTVRLNRAMSLPGETLASPAQFTFTVGAEVDLTPPSVMDVSPAQSATDVPLDAAFVLRLSEPIDPASISAASLHGPRGLVDFTPELDASRTILRLTPKAPLEPQASYSVTVNGAIRDVAGNRLEQNFQFMTGGTAAAATSSLLRRKGR